MADTITAIPAFDEYMENAPPEVRAVGAKVKEIMARCRTEKGAQFCNVVEFLYAFAQLRLFINTVAPPEAHGLCEVLIAQVAKNVERLIHLEDLKDFESASAQAEQLVRMCLIRQDEDGNPEPDRRH